MVGVREREDPLRFGILGTLRACRGGSELALGPVKQRAVLAVLTMNANRAVPITQIVDAVWGDDPPENGTNVVQKYVAGLRRVLEPDRSPRSPGNLLSLSGAGYLLSVAPDCLDAEVFGRLVAGARSGAAEGRTAEAVASLTEAAGLWRGEALAGLSGPVFDAARVRLAESRAAALEMWAELELRLGRHAALVPRLLELVADYPLREQPRYLLILSLYRSGRQAEALAAFRDARRFFADEFGVEPGERLQRLHRAILRGDPELLAPAEPPPAEPLPIEPTPAEPTQAKPLPAAPLPAMSTPAGSTPPGSAPPGSTPPGSPSAHAAWAQPPAALQSSPDGRSSPVAPPRRRTGRFGRVVAIGLPVITGGLAAWAVVGFYATRRRSRMHGLAAAAYLALFSVSFVLLGTAPGGTTTLSDALCTATLFAVWIGGTAHAATLALGRPEPHSTVVLSLPDVVALERRAKREQARQIAASRPSVARQLNIGRPDLPRVFDDGGLVSINDVSEWVWAQLPGVTPEQAGRILEHRRAGHAFASVDDLVSRQLLPAESVRMLRDVLIVVA